MSMTLNELYERMQRLRPNKIGCLIWGGKPGPGGYAWEVVTGQKTRRLNRIILERKLGRPIRRGYLSLHTCDNPMCVSETHLYEGTPKQNTADMYSRGRSSWQRNGWPSGRRKRSFITDEQVLEIRALYAEGLLSQEKIGARYSLTQQSISDIVTRRYYTDI